MVVRLEKKKTEKQIFVIATVLLLLVAAIYYIYKYNVSSTEDSTANGIDLVPTTECATQEIPKVINKAQPGVQEYSVSGSSESSVTITHAKIDPEYVRVGQLQKMSIKVISEMEIKSVEAQIESDNGIKVYTLSLVDGSNTDGTWEGEWMVEDTHEKDYATTFVAVDKDGNKDDVRLSWTDPSIGCTFSGGNATCTGGTLSGVADGADGTQLTVTTGDITVPSGATLVYGTQMLITSGGRVLISSGGQIRQGYIHMTDSDGDGYPASQTFAFSTNSSPTAPTRRRGNTSIVYTNDCTDTDASNYPGAQCCSITAGTDPNNYCSAYACSDYVWGWNGQTCKKALINSVNGTCNGSNACYSGFTTICQEGSTLVVCGSSGCNMACPQGSVATSYDTVAEVCYTSGQHGCSSGYVCNSTGTCVPSGCWSSNGTSCNSWCMYLSATTSTGDAVCGSGRVVNCRNTGCSSDGSGTCYLAGSSSTYDSCQVWSTTEPGVCDGCFDDTCVTSLGTQCTWITP